MRRGTVAIVAVGMFVVLVAEAHARPGGGRAGGVGRSGGAGARSGGGPSRSIDRPAFEGGRQGGAISNAEPGPRSMPSEGLPRGSVQNNFFNNANERLGGDKLNGALDNHLNALPEPRRGTGVQNATPQNATPQNAARRNLAENQNRSDLRAQFAPSQQPFTPQWYADHPNAWQATHPHADAWAAATVAGATAWLGWGTAPAYSYGTYYSETPSEEVVAEADALASNGSQEVDQNGEWMNIGTYALAPKGSSEATLMLSLAVDKDGILRGTYYDLLSNSAETIQGAIDKGTRRAAWRVGNGKVTFQTTLNDLTSDLAAVSLQFENGQSALWSLARQNP